MTSTPTMLRKTGATYRQLDHWVRKGYLETKGVGTGNAREWSRRDLAVATSMVKLVNAGLTPEAAAALADHGYRNGVPGAIADNGVVIQWGD